MKYMLHLQFISSNTYSCLHKNDEIICSKQHKHKSTTPVDTPVDVEMKIIINFPPGIFVYFICLEIIIRILTPMLCILRYATRLIDTISDYTRNINRIRSFCAYLYIYRSNKLGRCTQPTRLWRYSHQSTAKDNLK